jgi:hypothetical protein
MNITSTLLSGFLLTVASVSSVAETSLLFIGNSFTYGHGSATNFYRADTVTDLNNRGIGGVPALFKSFADQAGLDYSVSLETYPGSDLYYHLQNKQGLIGQKPWNQVVMHGYSTLDLDKPGDPNLLIKSAADMSTFLQGLNRDVEIFLTATWSRADLIYLGDSLWTDTPINQMAQDIRGGYDKAAKAPGVKSVNPVGEAWTRAMEMGLADTNPYDGIEQGKINLWTYDHYHASKYGYYLEALVVFGNITGLDPRSLGENECSGYELGMSRSVVKGLQQAAYDQLASESRVSADPLTLTKPAYPQRCH